MRVFVIALAAAVILFVVVGYAALYRASEQLKLKRRWWRERASRRQPTAEVLQFRPRQRRAVHQRVADINPRSFLPPDVA